MDFALHNATLVTIVTQHENKSESSTVTVTTINRIAMILMSAQYSDKKLKIKYNY
jgi:hypothetical protein